MGGFVVVYTHRKPGGEIYCRGFEIGLKAPSNIDKKKTSDVGLLGGAESSAWSAERLEAVLHGCWAASEATSWGPQWGAEPLAARLPFTTQER